MHTQFYLIKPLSNLHVGSGDVSVGVIDNLIQRDVLTEFPTIHSSSLKGSIREFCKYSKLDDSEIKKIFGSDSEATKKEKGAFRFFDASLLAIPVRTDKVPYLMATSVELLQEFVSKMEQFGIKGFDLKEMQEFIKMLGKVQQTKKSIVFHQSLEGATIEELDFKAGYDNKVDVSSVKKMIGGNDHIVILSDENMRLICDNNHLPVIARNHLENGTSANLWYEQVLPRYSLLYFPVVGNDVNTFKNFDEILESSPVSIGANASIGYGYCKISKLEYNETK